jgi:hypothetical protein
MNGLHPVLRGHQRQNNSSNFSILYYFSVFFFSIIFSVAACFFSSKTASRMPFVAYGTFHFSEADLQRRYICEGKLNVWL